MKIGIAAVTLESDLIPAAAAGSDVSAVDGGALTEASYSDSTGASSTIRYETITGADGNVTGQVQTSTSTDANGVTYSSVNHYDAGGALTETSYLDSTGANSSTRYETITDADGNVTGQVHFSDESPVDSTPIDGGTVEVVPVDGSENEVIDRPIDPQPEWRTIDGVYGNMLTGDPPPVENLPDNVTWQGQTLDLGFWGTVDIPVFMKGQWDHLLGGNTPAADQGVDALAVDLDPLAGWLASHPIDHPMM